MRGLGSGGHVCRRAKFAKKLRVTGFVTGFFETEYLIGLRALCSLNDVELDFIPFFKALVALPLDGAVVDEDVCSPLAAQESITFRVVEPLYRAFVLCQWSNSLICRSEPGPNCREVRTLQR